MLTIAESDIQEGQMRKFKIGDKFALVTKVEGEVYAINNKCTHFGCSLNEGELEGKIVTCPCHGTRFNVTTGKVVEYLSKWPKLAGKIASIVIKDAEVFEVEVKDDQVQISSKGK